MCVPSSEQSKKPCSLQVFPSALALSSQDPAPGWSSSPSLCQATLKELGAGMELGTWNFTAVIWLLGLLLSGFQNDLTMVRGKTELITLHKRQPLSQMPYCDLSLLGWKRRLLREPPHQAPAHSSRYQGCSWWSENSSAWMFEFCCDNAWGRKGRAVCLWR